MGQFTKVLLAINHAHSNNNNNNNNNNNTIYSDLH